MNNTRSEWQRQAYTRGRGRLSGNYMASPSDYEWLCWRIRDAQRTLEDIEERGRAAREGSPQKEALRGHWRRQKEWLNKLERARDRMLEKWGDK
jgi:hypothetical protein